jgi:hypothetical protein
MLHRTQAFGLGYRVAAFSRVLVAALRPRLDLFGLRSSVVVLIAA